MEKFGVYPYSFAYASGVGTPEVEIYKKSMEANIACKDAIADMINKNYDGSRIKVDIGKEAIKEFGIDRVQYVLANSVKHKDHDGRISRENKEWAKETFVPLDLVDNQDRSRDFAIDKDGLLNIVVNQFKRAYKALDLWDKEQMNSPKGMNFEGKIMVLEPTMLKDDYKTREHQLFFCSGSSGCNPKARGRQVTGEFLKDGEKARYYREDFVGEAKIELLPQWAKEKLAEKSADRESARIMLEFRKLKEPNSLNKKHFMVKISDEAMERMDSKGFDKFYHVFPFKSFAIVNLNNDKGVCCLINKDEDRSQNLIKPKASVLEKLKNPKVDTIENPKEPTISKTKEVL